MVGDRSEALESVTGHDPFTLRKNVESSQNLQELIDSWSTSDNAISVSTHGSVCKVLQIDRMFHNRQGQPCKTASQLRLGQQVLLPHFVIDTTYELVPYYTTAIYCHCLSQGTFWSRTLSGGTQVWRGVLDADR